MQVSNRPSLGTSIFSWKEKPHLKPILMVLDTQDTGSLARSCSKV